jgi:hypothetical protein
MNEERRRRRGRRGNEREGELTQSREEETLNRGKEKP